MRDPYRGKGVKWFHPKEDNWDHHFVVRANAVVGVTEVGRAACAVLFSPRRNTPDLKSVSFTPADAAGDEGLVAFIRRLIGEQREGTYNQSLDSTTLLSPWLAAGTPPADLWVADFASQWLPAMARWKRGNDEDMRLNWRNSLVYYARGRDVSAPSHAERFRLEWVATNAILIATTYDRVENYDKASRFRRFSVNLYDRIASDTFINDPWLIWRANANRMMLEQSPVQWTAALADRVLEQEESGSYQLVCDWVDAVVRSRTLTSSSTIELAWSRVDGLMLRSGYGAGGDIAEAVGLRRRWWLLQLRLAEPIDVDLLSWDLKYWRASGLMNEDRLLKVDIARMDRRLLQELEHRESS